MASETNTWHWSVLDPPQESELQTLNSILVRTTLKSSLLQLPRNRGKMLEKERKKEEIGVFLGHNNMAWYN